MVLGVMVSRGRHPKQPIAAALAAVARPGLAVEEIHQGHRWGVLRCTVCKDRLAIWSTPRVPETLARRIRRFDVDHRHEGDPR
jgi:hypothetical protein